MAKSESFGGRLNSKVQIEQPSPLNENILTNNKHKLKTMHQIIEVANDEPIIENVIKTENETLKHNLSVLHTNKNFNKKLYNQFENTNEETREEKEEEEANANGEEVEQDSSSSAAEAALLLTPSLSSSKPLIFPLISTTTSIPILSVQQSTSSSVMSEQPQQLMISAPHSPFNTKQQKNQQKTNNNVNNKIHSMDKYQFDITTEENNLNDREISNDANNIQINDDDNSNFDDDSNNNIPNSNNNNNNNKGQLEPSSLYSSDDGNMDESYNINDGHSINFDLTNDNLNVITPAIYRMDAIELADLDETSRNNRLNLYKGRDVVTKFLQIVESQHLLGANCTAGTALNLGEGVVDRYAQDRFRVEAEIAVNRANMLTR